tara:strand:+ start:1508 stop:1714 length:207 start_codon:yes stop_codon:yes gene_type:complete
MFQGFSTGLMKKDSGVALQIAYSNKIDMPLGKLAQDLLNKTIEEFGLDADMSKVAISYEETTGVKIRP